MEVSAKLNRSRASRSNAIVIGPYEVVLIRETIEELRSVPAGRIRRLLGSLSRSNPEETRKK